MCLLKTFFSRPRHTSQAQLVRRAAAVIDRVIEDVGAETLVAGVFVLQKSLRLRFIGVAPGRWPDVIASLPVSEIAAADLPRGFDATGRLDLAHAVVRELAARAPALRALPALES